VEKRSYRRPRLPTVPLSQVLPVRCCVVRCTARNVSDSGSVWDGIVGVRGVNRYSPKWSSIYSLSGGAGDSKYTWQANVSLAYKFDTVSAAVGWQYLTWDFENDAPLQDMTINGPYVGAIFHF